MNALSLPPRGACLLNRLVARRGAGHNRGRVRRRRMVMDKTDFDYALPEARIAQAPLAERRASRLLCMDRANGALADRQIVDLVDLLGPDDLLVFNDTDRFGRQYHFV